MVSSNYEFILQGTRRQQQQQNGAAAAAADASEKQQRKQAKRTRAHSCLKTKATFFWLLRRWKLTKCALAKQNGGSSDNTPADGAGGRTGGNTGERTGALAATAAAASSFNAIFSSIFCANDKKFYARIFSIFARPKKFHALWKLVKLW